MATWNISCKTKGGIMLVPSGFTFLLQRVNFDGTECQPNTVVQVDGKIMAPSKNLNWAKHDLQWILFNGVSKGMTIKGEGVIDGFGDSWWNTNHTEFPPHVCIFVIIVFPNISFFNYILLYVKMIIEKSSNITITGITIENSPLMHMFIENCKYVTIHNFTLRSPAHSPNTDGIHISRVQHVLIYNTTIACGDDCVSIQTGCSDVKIYDVKCGPGHGFSIGGLGPKLEEAHVSDIAVFNSSVQDAMTGVRIKTWPGGHGSVRNIVFQNIGMWNVGTPIVIDQFYCGGHTICNVTDSDMNAVAISNVMYHGISGTYSYKPVSLACSYSHPCTNLMVAAVHLLPTKKSAGADPHCFYAYGKLLTNNTPSLDYCLDPQQPPSPISPSPHHPHVYCRRPGCAGEHSPPPIGIPTAAPPSTVPSPTMLSSAVAGQAMVASSPPVLSWARLSSIACTVT
ncbi:hypothetical protein C2S52_002618 [Perilla frutescens var. hirtella]|nr:hypothetical protein C2S52_002618 [Perilla frutescens var. hirtella]